MRHVLRVFSAITFLGLSVAGFLAVFYWQDVQDYYKFSSYQPSSSIAQLADRSGMSDRGKFYFYIASPQLESATQFNSECRRVEQGSPILGCYKPSTDTIHIYNIDNPELNGIQEVTAAHEMLHMVFSRLSADEVEAIASHLEQAYQRVITDKLEERMAYYERTSPGSRVNELHSIIGTEFLDIGDELEAHYAKYFDDRQATVRLHQSYSQKFEDIERQITELSALVSEQADTIDDLAEAYEQDLQSLNRQIEDFNSRANGGQFSSREEFDRERQQLNMQVSQLNSQRDEVMQLIDKYKENVAKLNDLGGKADELNREIDSLQEVSQGVEAI